METVKLEISIAGLPDVMGLVHAVTGVIEQLGTTGCVHHDDACVDALIAAANGVCDSALSDDVGVEVEIETTVDIEVELEAEAAGGEPGEVDERDEAGGGSKVCGLSAL